MRSKTYVLALLLLATLVLMPFQVITTTYNAPEKTLPMTGYENIFSTPSPSPKATIPSYDYKLEKIDSIIDAKMKPRAVEHSSIEFKGFPNTITITGTYIIEDETRIYNDTGLIVLGNLTIINSTIIFNSTAAGNGGIIVKSGGVLNILDGSEITYINNSYIIQAEENTEITIDSGKITGCMDFSVGLNYTTTMANLTIENSELTATYLSAMNSSVVIDNTNLIGSSLFFNNSDVSLTNIAATANLVDAYLEILMVDGASTLTVSNLDVYALANGSSVFIAVDILAPTVTVNIFSDVNITLTTDMFSYAIAIYSTASFEITNLYLDGWMYGLSLGELIVADGAALTIKNSVLEMHPYEGCGWGVLLESIFGIITVEDSDIYIDAYGYGGPTEYDSYFIAPIFTIAGTVNIVDSKEDAILRGFAFAVHAYLYLGVSVAYIDTDAYIATYDDSFIYAIFYAYPGVIDVHGSEFEMPVYGNAFTFFFISTEEVGSAYNITDSTIGGLCAEGIVAVNSTVYVENTTLYGFWDAIVLSGVPEATIKDSTFLNNTRAIGIGGESGYGGEILIENCKFVSREFNIDASYSANVKIVGCEFHKTTEFGILFTNMLNVSLINNTMIGVSPVFVGTNLTHFSTHNITGNKVNGKDLLYLVNATNQKISGDYGAVILAGADNVTVEGISVSDVTAVITVAFSEDVTIKDLAVDMAKYGVYAFESDNVEVVGSKIIYAERAVYAVSSDVFVGDSDIRYSANGIFAEEADISVNKTQFYMNGVGIAAVDSNIEVTHSVILLSAQYGISLSGNITKAEVHYCSIYSNRLHGIYSASNVTVDASNNWWGVDGQPPELKEMGDPSDPEEVWGKFTDSTFDQYLEEAMWSPSEEGVIPIQEVPTIPNYVLVVAIVIVGIIVAAALIRKRA